MSISAMSAAADQLENSRVGYDQGNRWSFLDRQNGRIIPDQETDCSAGCGGIAWLGGYPVNLEDPFYTGNFKTRLEDAGFSAINITGKPLATIKKMMKEGDFILGFGHVVYVRGDGRWWSAEADERGKASGGKSGDQTSREARNREPYARSRGWDWILRPQADSNPAPVAPQNTLEVDGELGPHTVSRLQEVLKNNYNAWGFDAPLEVDGDLGKNTVRALQRVLNQEAGAKLQEDGALGPKTIKALQTRLGVKVDGTVGPQTIKALQDRLNANTL